MKRFLTLVALLAFTTGAWPAAGASTSNLEREKNWADQIVDSLIAGEAVWLQAQNTKFLGLYTQPSKSSGRKRAVILIHGRGVHPAWGFIDNLRIDLADAGWHTLSLQMPILDADIKMSAYAKTFPEAFARIDAGLAFLKQRGINEIFLVGHSSGAMTSVAYVAEHPNAPITGIAAVGLTTESAGGPYMQPVQMLPKIKKPILDIYGAEDLAIVLKTADARRAAAAKAGNSAYTQERVKGANHFFTDRYDPLRASISNWLAKTATK